MKAGDVRRRPDQEPGPLTPGGSDERDQAVTRAGQVQGAVEPLPHDGLGPDHDVPVVPIADDATACAKAASLFPLARWLSAADVIVAAGGYHAFHEVRASGVPAVFLPQSRRYDDQEARVRGECVARTPEELEARVREALVRPRMLARDASLGAVLVARLLQRRMEKGVLSQEEIAALAGGVGSAGSEAPPHLL